MLKTRVMTACALAAVLLLLLFFLPDWAWGLVVAVVVWFASGEWARLVGASRVGRHIFGLLAIAPIVAWSFAKSDP
ncbi:MAG: Phosphatidate cytidylyltransferase, partial [Rhodocyclales bacterium]|nr:Phosphatidate cytidylyltransferase [Rhodocyclales bacterium]